MKICIDLTSLADHFSGVERYGATLAETLIRENKVNCILLFKGRVHPFFWVYEKHPRVRVVVLPDCGSKVLFNQVTLFQALCKIKADAYLFPAFPMPVLLRKKNCFTVIHDVACFDVPSTMRFFQRMYYVVSRLHEAATAKQVLTISEFSRKRIIHRLPLKNPEVANVSCGIDDRYIFYRKNERVIEKARKKYRIPEEYIFSLSTLEPRKNLKQLILEYDALVQEGHKMPALVLAGRKGWRMLDFLNGISKRTREKIYITGFVDEEDLPALYGGAVGFVFPSIYEGFGIPPVEAMACGVPVLSSDAEALKEVLRDAPLYFPLKEKDGMRKGLLRLCGLAGKEREDVIQRGQEIAREYSFKRVADQTIKAIRKAKGYIG